MNKSDYIRLLSEASIYVIISSKIYARLFLSFEQNVFGQEPLGFGQTV